MYFAGKLVYLIRSSFQSVSYKCPSNTNTRPICQLSWLDPSIAKCALNSQPKDDPYTASLITQQLNPLSQWSQNPISVALYDTQGI